MAVFVYDDDLDNVYKNALSYIGAVMPQQQQLNEEIIKGLIAIKESQRIKVYFREKTW